MRGAHPAQGFLNPIVSVVSHVIVEHGDELVNADAIPVPSVEELVLEPSEEALHGGVVGRAPLLRHGADELVLLADLDPPGPSVMASAIAVDHGPLAAAERAAGFGQHRVGHVCVGALPYRPGHGHAVEAVDYGAQTGLAGGDGELRHVGEPKLVRSIRMEVAPHQVLGSGAYLTFVGAVAPLSLA